MIRWKTIVATLLAFIYPLAAGYCLFEKIELVEAVDCCAETASHDHEEQAPCGGYGCCPIEYAVYSSFDSGITDLPTPPADVVFLTVVLLTELPVEVPVAQLERSPPDIPKSWQFAFRTALPPRAPSLIS